MSDLTTKPAELRMTLQIVRAATGKTETVDLVGHVIPLPEAESEPTNEEGNGNHPLRSSP